MSHSSLRGRVLELYKRSELEPTNLNSVNNLRRVVDAASPFGWH